MHEAFGCAVTQRQTFHLDMATRPHVTTIHSAPCEHLPRSWRQATCATCCLTLGKLLAHRRPKMSDLQKYENGAQEEFIRILPSGQIQPAACSGK